MQIGLCEFTNPTIPAIESPLAPYPEELEPELLLLPDDIGKKPPDRRGHGTTAKKLKLFPFWQVTLPLVQ
jgi:hypothetical protein